MPGTGNRPRLYYCVTALSARLCAARNRVLNRRQLIEEALRLGQHETVEEAVTAALEEYIRWRKQMGILELFGTVDFDPEYDYKAERRRKRR